MIKKFHTSALYLLMLLFSIAVSACGSNAGDAPPTVDLKVLETHAFATFSAQITQTALYLPTATPFSTSTGTLIPTILPPVVSPVKSATASCYDLKYSEDVTIPDNTAMTPGKSFTKTWEVYNNGTCKWEEGFKLSFSSGNDMNAERLSLKLTKAVEPNKKVELSINMAAPNKAGKFTGVWRMGDANGDPFGETLTVVIQVGGPTLTITPTKTATATLPIATFTPVPPTATFTPMPPTATFTPVPPTATLTPVPPTETPTESG